ncbi:hypothetical protein RN001_001787 [Aquatica leii]|uniref:Uncharacterized protein n=1 Tax=Aquatica leii TaxID=1421715 RepID=A0AAN7PP09_9COLE|nr:hypothetical protein RN001_001787 [Aquatica leii]
MIAPLFLNIIIRTIANNYFNDSMCILILTENNNDFQLNALTPIVNIRITNNSLNNNLVFHKYGCQAIIINTKKPSLILQKLESQMKLHGDRFNSRKYLIIANNIDIFNLPELNYIVNVLMIIPANTSEEECILFNEVCHKHGTFKLVTHKYIGKSQNNDPVILDFWTTNNNSFTYGNNLYPDKLHNQEGRTLRCATFNYKPYSIIKNSPLNAIGSENAIAYEFAKNLNMSIVYVLDNKEWGVIYDNWTGDGILGNVALDKADIGYGALYTWAHEYGFLDLSKPVVRTGITCLVPAPKLAAGWLTPILPFSLQMWLYFALSFVLISIATIGITAVISMQKLKTYKKIIISYRIIFNQSLIRITKIFLMQSVSPTGKIVDISLKYMFSLFLYSLVISASYTGVINNVFDLANSDINWGATQNAWIYSILEEERSDYVKLLRKFIATSEENLLQFAEKNQFAFSIERLPSGQFAVGNYITEDIVQNLRLMHEDLYWEYCVFMLRKSSPLLYPLDKLINRLNEVGLIKFWEKKAAQTHMNLRVQNIVGYYRASQTKQPNSVVVTLQWIHVEGVFGSYNLDAIKAIQWGRDNEKCAIEAICTATGLTVVTTGLWLHECGFIVASPDGLVRDTAMKSNVYLSNGMQIYQNFCKMIATTLFIMLLKIIRTVLMQLHILNRAMCYLIVWTLAQIVIVQIKRSENWADNLNI